MARGDKSESISQSKKAATKTRRKLQSAGVGKRAAERSAWDSENRKRATASRGTASGRSKVSKRTMKPKGSTRKSKTTGKTRR